ncbi:MAG: glycosyltransferase family 2 protein, partial [Candidatus Promineifilaceae bacterium]
VSIGLPVFNGEDYIAQAIESVVNQTYSFLELIISDNGSCDATETICRNYAAHDGRVRYYRSKVNLGASWNYNRTVDLARGKYFRWLAHDDALDPTLVEKSVSVLEESPGVILCFTWTKDIDGDGKEIAVKKSTRKYADDDRSVRFFSLGLGHPIHNCEEVFGLVRTKDLRQTPIIANYSDSDRTLLARLALQGAFYEIPEPLFLHRLHDRSSVKMYPEDDMRMIWFDPTKEGKPVFPTWRQVHDLFLASNKTAMTLSERSKCYFAWLRLANRRRHGLFAEVRRGFGFYIGRLISQVR